MSTILARAYVEIGLPTFFATPYDVKVLALQRFVRLAAYGASTLVLVLYLTALNISVTRVGLFMTLTLVGDVLISLVLTVIADAIGRRRMLALGSLLMSASGVVFATQGNYWVLLTASIVGVISPSGNEIGPFKAIEESTIAQLTGKDDRPSVLAWYTLHGSAGVAMGTIVAGWSVRQLQVNAGWTNIESYRAVFWAYAVMGLVKFALCLLLGKECEVEGKHSLPQQTGDEREPLLTGGTESVKPATARRTPERSLLPKLSVETQRLLVILCLLFAVDSFASGLSPAAWLIFFFNRKFGLSEARLGNLFFVTNILSSASNLVAASLARRIGLVKTMVFTHAPASIALLLLPIPGNVVIAMALLVVRASISSMDQAPRQAFLSAAVLPAERTAVMGVVNVVKTLSQSAGPVITGKLAGSGMFWVAFVFAGSLKLLYDAVLLGLFLGYRTVEDKAEETVSREAEREREEGTDQTRDTS